MKTFSFLLTLVVFSNHSFAGDDGFRFDLTTGKCTNGTAEGLNPDFQGECGNLKNRNFAKTDFSMATLNGADFTGSNLSGAVFTGADLIGVKFIQANLSAADFTMANLTSAKIIGANLRFTNLAQATLENTDFSDSTFDKSTMLPFNQKDAQKKGMLLLDNNFQYQK